MKDIVWLDDQFTEGHKYLLTQYLDALQNIVNVTTCTKLSEFIENLKQHSFHGIVLDVMLKREIDIHNYELLGRNNIRYIPTKAGLQIAEILRDLDGGNSSDNSNFSDFYQTPLLILTNETDSPWERYALQHPDLLKHAKDTSTPSLKIYSKGESDIEIKLQQWARNLT